MQLSDCEDAGEHGLHGAVVQGGGGEPQGAVGDAAALGVKVEQVGALLHRLRAERRQNDVNVTMETGRITRQHGFHFGGDSPLGEVELVESDGTAERVLCVLHHLQDVLLTLLLPSPLSSWNLWI